MRAGGGSTNAALRGEACGAWSVYANTPFQNVVPKGRLKVAQDVSPG